MLSPIADDLAQTDIYFLHLQDNTITMSLTLYIQRDDVFIHNLMKILAIDFADLLANMYLIKDTGEPLAFLVLKGSNRDRSIQLVALALEEVSFFQLIISNDIFKDDTLGASFEGLGGVLVSFDFGDD